MTYARSLLTPTRHPLQRRNTLADWAFYDVQGLTHREFDWLARERATEGSILVVLPSREADDLRVLKYADHHTMCAAPGDVVRHFAIAGVGSSDVGAAALARTLANHLQAPVGAIVAGYGMSDLLQEALGGWFFFGAANRAQAAFDRFGRGLPRPLREAVLSRAHARVSALAEASSDTATLLCLLRDEGREIDTLLGHSKGCLSIAFALHHLRDRHGEAALIPFQHTRIITAGAVVGLPQQLERVQQYLGGIDWFGALNSLRSAPHTTVPGAWHHLNTRIPGHMNLAEVLRGIYGAVPA